MAGGKFCNPFVLIPEKPSAIRPMFQYLLLLLLLVFSTVHYVSASDRIVFIENRGQIVDASGQLRPDILYTAEAPGVTIYCRRDGISYVFSRIENDQTKEKQSGAFLSSIGVQAAGELHTAAADDRSATVYRMDVKFEGATSGAVTGWETTREYFNYYYAHCPEGIANVRGYRRIEYRNVYPDIDFVLYTQAGGLKYDFIVHPGGNPDHIKLRYEGADALTLMHSGALQIQTPLGSIEEKTPYTYQGKREITGRYRVKGNTVKFEVGQYNPKEALIIDPGVVWSTYYGGSTGRSSGRETAKGVATDGSRNVVVAGWTVTVDFPVQNALQSTSGGQTDSYVLKFTPDGELLWATYYGGSDIDCATSVAVNNAGIIAITGVASSPDFPVENALQNTYAGSSDAFAVCLTPAGQRIWATYFGSSASDKAYGVGIDENGAVAIMGVTGGTNLPVLNAYQAVAGGGGGDVFVARINSAGQLLWSTYFGGSGADGGVYGIVESGTDHLAIDGSGNIIIATSTRSSDFPVLNAFQPQSNGGDFDACIAKFNPNGALLWSTYYGGSAVDIASGVGVDNLGNIAVSGNTLSADFPVQNAFQSTLQGTINTFLIKFTSSGQRVWATYVRGSWCHATAAAADGSIYITGRADASLPVIKPWQTWQGDGGDPFLLQFDEAGQVVWGTLFGGNDSGFEEEDGLNIAVDLAGDVIIVGYTADTNMPMINSWQSTLNDWMDSFIVKFGCVKPGFLLRPTSPVQLCEGQSLTISAPKSYASYLWSNGATTSSIEVEEPGGYSVLVSDGPACTVLSTTVIVNVVPRPLPVILGDSVVCTGSSVRLHTNVLYESYRWTRENTPFALSTTAICYAGEAGEYQLTVVDGNGCVGTSASFTIHSIPQPETAVVLMPTGATVLCPGDSVTLTAVGDFPHYLWSNGATTAAITVRDAGVYVLLAADTNGCMSKPVVTTINVVSHIADTILGPLHVCIGTEHVYTVQVLSGVQYTWVVTGGTVVSDPTSATARIRWEETGDGSVMVIRAVQGCVDSLPILQITIADGLKPVILGPSSLCPDEQIVLAVDGVYESYLWSDGQNTTTLTVTVPGVYSVHVTGEDECTGTSLPFIVTVATIPTPAIIVDGLHELCPGDSTVLRLSENFVSYLWSDGSTASSLTVFSAGTASVRVVSSEGCSATTTLTIDVGDPPHPTVSGPMSLCPNTEEEYSTDATGFSFMEWKISGGTILSGESTATVRVRWANGPTGTLALKVRRAGTSCVGETVVHIAIGENIHPVVTSSSLVLCPDGTVLLHAPAGYVKYKWSPGGETGKTLEITQPGIYSVHVSNGKGCEGASDPVEVRAGQVPDVVISASDSTPCKGEVVVLSAGAGFVSYLWSTGETTSSITVHDGGDYGVSVNDGSGCSGSTTMNVRYTASSFGDNSSVTWPGIPAGTAPQMTYTWINDGTETVHVESWSFVPAIPKYSATFTPTLPADIPPGGSLAITVRLQASEPGLYRSDLVVESPLPCAQTLRISFDATVVESTGATLSMQVYFPDTTAFPWQRSYRIPLYARLLSSESAEPYTVEFTAAMDADVFFPTGLTRGTMTDNRVDAATGERIIRGRMENVEFGSETILTEIVGDVLLGERDRTVLVVRNVAVVDSPVAAIQKADGTLTLEGICREGDTRFVRSKAGFGITIQPQPAVQGELVVLVEVVESGECRLVLYSADGRSEEIQQWRHTLGSDEARIVRYDVSSRSAGVYWLVLRTPTQTSAQQFLIVK